MTEKELFEWLQDRVWFEPNTGCWLWALCVGHNGYSTIWDSRLRKNRNGHRLVLELYLGGLDKTLDVHHICNNRLCVNPKHLRQVTRSKNLAYKPKQLYCWRGHPLSTDNVRIYKGSRYCKKCDLIRGSKYRKRLRDSSIRR